MTDEQLIGVGSGEGQNQKRGGSMGGANGGRTDEGEWGSSEKGGEGWHDMECVVSVCEAM